MWNRMAKIISNSYCVLLGDASEAFEVKENANLSFDFYVPNDIDKFKKKFRVKINSVPTLLCRGNKVVFVYNGKITGDVFTHICRLADKVSKE